MKGRFLLAFLGLGLLHPHPAALGAAFNGLDISDRQQVKNFYNGAYLQANDAPPNWTGSFAVGNYGETSQALKDATALRINWFRTMAGIPAGLTFDPVLNRKCQQAAVMVSANNELNHHPPSTWANFTAEGAEASGASDLAIGDYGPDAVTSYIREPGNANFDVGHRRWLLFPYTSVMGTGDVPPTGNLLGANAIWVTQFSTAGARPATRDDFVAWPPPGFVPYQVVFPRWSISYPGANFSGATVAMAKGGAPLGVKLETIASGLGENTLVWIPTNIFANSSVKMDRPTNDTVFSVTVNNVIVGGSPRSFTYNVTIFDPADPPASPAPTPLWQQKATMTATSALGLNGFEYFFTAGRLKAVEASSGGIKWQRFVAGGDNSPVINDAGSVFLGISSNPGGMAAFDGVTGSPQWTFPTEGDVRSNPALGTNQSIFFGTANSISNGITISHGVFYCVDAAGNERWKFPAGADIATSPVVVNNLGVVFGTSFKWLNGRATPDGKVFALNAANGSKRWEFQADGALLASPAVGADGTIYVGTLVGRFYALNPANGQKRWEFVARGQCQSSSPAIGSDGTVYFGTSARFYALNGQTGERRWSLDSDEPIYSSPAIDANGTLYVGWGTRKLVALETASGALKWAFEPGSLLSYQSPVIGRDNALHFATADRTQFVPDAGFQTVAEGMIYALPMTVGPAKSPWPMFGQNERHSGKQPAPETITLRFSQVLGFPTRVELELTASADVQVVVRESLNLTDWHVVETLPTVANRARLTNTISPGPQTRFYRADLGPP